MKRSTAKGRRVACAFTALSVLLLMLLPIPGCFSKRSNNGSSNNQDNEKASAVPSVLPDEGAFSDAVGPVKSKLELLFNSNDFINADLDAKRGLLNELLYELSLEGSVKGNISWNDAHYTVSFKYRDGSEGGVSLRPFDDSLNSGGGSGTAYTNNKAEHIRAEAKPGILILNGFGTDAYRKNYYESLSDAWNKAGIGTALVTDATLSDLRQISGYDAVIFALHGEMLGSQPVFALEQKVNADTDGLFRKELLDFSIARVFGPDGECRYWVFPKFFAAASPETGASNQIIFSESCNFYGCDCRNGIDKAFAEAFINGLHAAAVIGYHNRVNSDYSREFMERFFENMFEGGTAGAALAAAKEACGADDGSSDPANDKYPAYAVLEGSGEAVLGNAAEQKPKFSSADAYSIAAEGLAFMYTGGPNYYDGALNTGYEAYRFDYDHDGTADLIIPGHPFWLVLRSGSAGFEGYVLEHLNSYMEAYSSSTGELVITNEYNGAFNGWTTYYSNDNSRFIPIITEERFTEPDPETGEYVMRSIYYLGLRDEEISESVYDSILASFGQLEKLEPSELELRKETCIDTAFLEEAANTIAALPFASLKAVHDLNDDGINDYVIELTADAKAGPNGVNIGPNADGWSNCCIILTSSGGNIISEICSVDAADSLLSRYE